MKKLVALLVLLATPALADTTITGPITFDPGFHITGAKVNTDVVSFGLLNPGSSWVPSFWGGITTTLPSVANVVSPVGGISLLGVTRSGDNPSTYNSIGVTGLAYNNNTAKTGPTGTWGAYIEANSDAGVATGTIGIEVDVGNRNSVVNIAPYSFGAPGMTPALWSACGALGSSWYGAGGTLSCTVALGILPNDKTFTKGIEFHTGALATTYGVGGNGVAIEMADGQSIRWATNTYNGGTGTTGIVGEMWGAAAGGLAVSSIAGDTPLTLTSSNTSSTGLALFNSATGGKAWLVSSTANASPIGGGALLFYDSSDAAIGMVLTQTGATFGGGITAGLLPTSAGSGGLYVCVDTAGVLYKKSACP